MLIRKYHLVIISDGIIEFHFLLDWKSFFHNFIFYFTQIVQDANTVYSSFFRDFSFKRIIVCLLAFFVSFYKIPVSSRTLLRVQIVYEMNVVGCMLLLRQLIVLQVSFQPFLLILPKLSKNLGLKAFPLLDIVV